MAGHGLPLVPTWYGFIDNTWDAVILFEAVLNGQVPQCHRRPHDRERQDLVRSGHVFVYSEHQSSIKRWTDGFNWSPSRILGNFLIYRELNKDFPPGEKKKATRRKKSSDGGVSKSSSSSPPSSANLSAIPSAFSEAPYRSQAEAELERSLVGSLIDSYPFKPDGLVKKTISIQWSGVPYHLVSYYNVDEARRGMLRRPFEDRNLPESILRPGLINQQNWRSPVEQEKQFVHTSRGIMPVEGVASAHAAAHAAPYAAGPAQPAIAMSFGHSMEAVARSTSISGVTMDMGMPPPENPYGVPQPMPSPLNAVPTQGYPGHVFPQPEQSIGLGISQPQLSPLEMQSPLRGSGAYETPSASTEYVLPVHVAAQHQGHGVMPVMTQAGPAAASLSYAAQGQGPRQSSSILSHETLAEPELAVTPQDELDAAADLVHAAMVGANDPMFDQGYLAAQLAMSQQEQEEVAEYARHDSLGDLAGQMDQTLDFSLDERWLENPAPNGQQPDGQPHHIPHGSDEQQTDGQFSLQDSY